MAGGRSAIGLGWVAALAALAPLANGQEPAPKQQPHEPKSFMGRAFVFRADVERARLAGWVGPDTPEDELLEAVDATLLRRVRKLASFPEAQVAREADARFSVTFVGPMPGPVEEFLIAGLSNPGRLAYRVVATEADLGPATDLAAQRRRLESWSAEHPQAPLAAFNRLPAAQGGPDETIVWLARRAETEPVAVLRDAAHPLLGADMKDGLQAVADSPAREENDLRFELEEEPAKALSAFADAHRGRELAFAINDEVVATSAPDAPLEGAVVVDTDLSMDQYRALLLAVTGGPLDVPLAFVERSKRPLENVKQRPPEVPTRRGRQHGG